MKKLFSEILPFKIISDNVSNIPKLNDKMEIFRSNILSFHAAISTEMLPG